MISVLDEAEICGALELEMMSKELLDTVPLLDEAETCGALELEVISKELLDITSLVMKLDDSVVLVDTAPVIAEGARLEVIIIELEESRLKGELDVTINDEDALADMLESTTLVEADMMLLVSDAMFDVISMMLLDAIMLVDTAEEIADGAELGVIISKLDEAISDELVIRTEVAAELVSSLVAEAVVAMTMLLLESASKADVVSTKLLD